MSIAIYRPTRSTSARILAEALNGRRVRHPENIRPADQLVAWGAFAEPHRQQQGNRALNNVPLRNKLSDAIALRAAGVPTIETSANRPPQSRPAGPEPTDPTPAIRQQALVNAQLLSGALASAQDDRAGGFLRELGPTMARLLDATRAFDTALAAYRALPPAVEWLGRMRSHQGGADLLNPPAQPEFWVKREQLVREFRVHSFLGRSIRAGMKIARESFSGTPHEWIRSFDAGWMISYDGETARQAHRDLAHAAVRALGLHFGAVDIGERADGSLIVLEVNRAPGLEGGSIDAYARAIQAWAAGNAS